MNKKKFIIVTIVLFLVFGLMVFTFANSNNKQDNEPKTNHKTNLDSDDKKTTDENDNDKQNNTEQNNVEQLDELRNTQTTLFQNKVDNSKQSNNNSNEMTIVINDDSYASALKLVIQAEKSYNKDDYNKAKEAVDKLTQNNDSKSLSDRLSAIADSFELENLVDSLVSMVNNRTSKDDMTKARDNEKENNIKKRVEDFSNNDSVKERLQNKLNSVDSLLNDMTAPTVELNNEQLTDQEDLFIKSGTLTATDDNDTYIIVNEEKELKLESNGFNLPSSDGKYTITVRDSAYNEITFTITIDNTNPEITNIADGTYYKTSVEPKIVEENIKDIVLIKDGQTIEYNIGENIVDDGTYNLTVTDKAGNKVTVNFTIDKKAPKITLKKYTKDNKGAIIEAGGYYNYSVAAYVEDSNLDTIKVDEEDYTQGSEIAGRKTHQVVARDKAGNETTVEFTIDKDYPLVYLNGKKNEKVSSKVQYFKENVQLKVSEPNLDKVVLTKDDEEIKFTNEMKLTEDGNYKITVTDKANIKTEVNFTIDKKAPKIILKKYTKDNKGAIIEAGGYYNYSVAAYVEDSNLDTIKVDEEDYTQGNAITGRKTHQVVARDKAGNETTVEFTIDKDYPLVYLNGKKNEKVSSKVQYFKEDVQLKVSEPNLDKVVLTKDGEEIEFTNEMNLTEDGNYKITVTDKANIKTEVNFTIDKEAPKITLKKYTKDNKGAIIEAGGYYNHSVAAYVEDSNLDTIKVDEEDYTQGSEIAGRKTHQVVARDKAGNETTVEFTIDKDYPLVYLNGKKNEKVSSKVQYFKEDVQLKVSEPNLDKVVLTKDDEQIEFTNEMKLTEDGNYKITVTDKANIKTEVNFIIDKTHPTINGEVRIVRADKNGSTYAKNGEDIIVSVIASEELDVKNLYVLVGESKTKYYLTRDNTTKPTTYRYRNAKITLTDDMKLKEDEKIQIKIFGTDLASNDLTGETVFTGNDTDYVIYNNEGPKAKEVTVKVTKSTLKYPYVKAGDEVEVRVGFKNSQYPKEFPIITVGEKAPKSITAAGTAYPGGYEGETAKVATFVIPDGLIEGALVPIKIVAKDAFGNETIITEKDLEEKYQLIYDNSNPTAEVTFDKKGWVNDSVKATLVASEPIETPDGFEKIDDKTFTKEYNEYTKEDIKLTDKVGNTGTVQVEALIDKDPVEVYDIKLEIIDENKNKFPYVGSGSKIKITYSFKDDQVTNPEFKINDTIALIGDRFVSCKVVDGETVCEKDTVVQEIIVPEGLTNDEYLPFTLTLYDKAGNKTVVTEQDIDEKNRLIVDSMGPTKKEATVKINSNTNRDYVTADDTVEISLEYSVGNFPKTTPVIEFNGELIKNIKGTSVSYNNLGQTKKYTFTITIPEELEDGKYIPLKITSQDLFGNESILTAEDISTKLIYKQTVNDNLNIPTKEEALALLEKISRLVESKNYVSENSNTEYYTNNTKVEAKNVLDNQEHYIIWFAEFKCDPSMCEGFDGHYSNGKVSSVIEGRRGDIDSITMDAPAANEGYKFVGWKKYDVEYSNIKFYGYEAVYEKTEVAKEANFSEIKKTQEQKTYLKQEQLNKLAESNDYVSINNKNENDEYYTNDISIKAKNILDTKEHYIIWFAEFKCDLSMCEGFDGHYSNGKVSSVIEGRRGNIDFITMDAPAAKEGYKFVGWKKYDVEYNNIKFYGYEAVYTAK